MTDAISLKEAAAIFGVDSSTFTHHVRPHLEERRFGRRPRFSRAECEALWREAGSVKPAPKGRARPPYVGPPTPLGAAPRNRLALSPEERKSFYEGCTPRQRIAFGVADARDVEYVACLDARKAARAEDKPLPKWNPKRCGLRRAGDQGEPQRASVRRLVNAATRFGEARHRNFGTIGTGIQSPGLLRGGT